MTFPGRSLNPLFIRSSIPFGTRPERNMTFPGRSLNPLFIRSSIPLGRSLPALRRAEIFVSIPYSSGHLFRFEDLPPGSGGGFLKSQSLIHQVIYSVTGIKLDSRRIERGVSIPYSSGHLFRLPREREMTRRRPKSQSLIHQVIYSVKTTKDWTESGRSSLNPLFIRSSIPFLISIDWNQARFTASQSLIHQVIYSVPLDMAIN